MLSTRTGVHKGERVMDTEAINCRRFLAAWGRFRGSQGPLPPQEDVETLYQFQLMAQHFQQLAAQPGVSDELRALEQEIAPVAKDIELLARDQDDLLMRFRVPTFARKHPRRSSKSPERMSPRSSDRALVRELVDARSESGLDDTHARQVSAGSATDRVVNEVELEAHEFETMLDGPPKKEERLTTRALRKRLGIGDRRGGEHKSATEAVAQAEQEALQSEMANLARQLKERTQTVNQTLVDDNKILDAVGESAESNTVLLERENAVLEKQLASSIGLWTSLWLIAMVAVVFVLMYLYMKVFGRRW